ncbi:hypothetical protein PybrP1_012951, partial [[Pythium] brassicae (nom. inval.)]
WRSVSEQQLYRGVCEHTPSLVFGVQHALVLHAAVVSLDHSGADMSDAPFELVAFLSALFPNAAELLDTCLWLVPTAPTTALLRARAALGAREALVARREVAPCRDGERRGGARDWHLAKDMGCMQTLLSDVDEQGLSVLVHAIEFKCPDEMTIWMAATVARTCLDVSAQLLQDRLYASAQRVRRRSSRGSSRVSRAYCERVLQDHFAGVPEFLLARCRQILTREAHDVTTAVNGLREVWQEFVDKWGYYGAAVCALVFCFGEGAPVIQKDLPLVLTAPVDSFVQISVVAKGEPLSYQWFYNGVPIESATQALLFISQSIQLHNGGSYHCEISNWKGSATTTVMKAEVVDDHFEIDPCLKYQVPPELLRGDDVVHSVWASTGAVLHHCTTGARVLLPPHCFKCVNLCGDDVSDSQGLQVVLRSTVPSAKNTPRLKLRHGEVLASCVIDILSHTAPPFLRPVSLSIPHCLSTLDTSSQLVVVRGNPATGECEDLASYSSEQLYESNRFGQVTVEVTTFGMFAVVSRSRSRDADASSPLEVATLFFVRPKIITAASYHMTVFGSLWVSRCRPDATNEAKAELWHHLETTEATSRGTSTRQSWAIDELEVEIRRTNVLCIQVSEKIQFEFQWEAPDDDASATRKNREVRASTMGDPSTRDWHHCIAPIVEVHPHEITEAVATPDEPLPPFCTVRLGVSVRKSSRSAAASRTVGNLLSEIKWNVLIPVANDAPQTPPLPQLALRTPSQVVLEFDPSKTLAHDETSSTKFHSNNRGSLTDTSTRARLAGSQADDLDAESADDANFSRFEPTHEGEREFSAYFYIVEMAKFSETFWQRYDQTWWFDKTKTEIINGMYKVVYAGFEPFTSIATDTYAGCFRVTQCSLDSRSACSEPMLLEPLAINRASAAAGTSGGGLVRKIRSIQSPSASAQSERAMSLQDCSVAILETRSRLHHLLTATYASDAFEHFEELFGFPNEGVDAVMKALETQTTKFRAANREVVLLLAALCRLEKRCSKVRLRKRCLTQWVSKMRLIERVVPELDCYPVEFFSKVTVQLHQLVQDMFRILCKLSSNGWMHQCVQAGGRFVWDFSLESFADDLASILRRLALLLTTEGGASLRGAKDIAEELGTFLECQARHPFGGDLDGVAVTGILRTFALQLSSRFGPSQSRQAKLAAAQQLVQSLELVPPQPKPVSMARDSQDPPVDATEHVVDEFLIEMEAKSTQDALAKLRDEDTLEKHIRSVAPADGDKCARIPSTIKIWFDPLVTLVDTQHVLKVANATRGNVAVFGSVSFSASEGVLTFTPTVAFERSTRYSARLRCDMVQTCIGSALQGTVRFRFSTT